MFEATCVFKDPYKTACLCTQNSPLRIKLALSLSKNVPYAWYVFLVFRKQIAPLNTWIKVQFFYEHHFVMSYWHLLPYWTVQQFEGHT